MGTRSTIHFVQKNDEQEETIASIYQQFDGYLDGVGTDLFNFLNSKIIVNGIGSEHDPSEIANGSGCLAAQFIAEHKGGPGGFYMTSPNDSQEYNYRVIFTTEGEGWNSIEVVSEIQVSSYGREFSGTLAEFGALCMDGFPEEEPLPDEELDQ